MGAGAGLHPKLQKAVYRTAGAARRFYFLREAQCPSGIGYYYWFSVEERAFARDGYRDSVGYFNFFAQQAQRFNQSRAIAIDMESATTAANGYRFRVPYGTLLCVSDRPLHGEIKLPGMADAFYEERVSQHLQIGIRALELIRKEAEAGTLHSRKLMSFTEPAFR